MPELPEVEAVARTVRPLVQGRRIRCVHVFHPIAVKPQSPAHLPRIADNRRIQAVTRRGKYLFLVLDRGTITLHFKLDGQLIWFDSVKDLLSRANQPLDSSEKRPATNVHVDVAFELDKGILGFADRRHFGRVSVYSDREAVPVLKSLGVDALAPEFTPRRFQELIAASRRPLKEFLLDQSRVAGVGNIYSSESLWKARIDPRRHANSLSTTETRRLHKAIVSVLNRALECCLHPAPDFRDPQWWFQGIEDILQVYDREGEKCRRCGAVIRRIAQGGRSTYCCVRCQK
jgi:formamidopyrimidine-DNA glycosylase